MAMTLEVGGEQYEGFTAVNVVTTLDTISGQFSFESAPLETGIYPFVIGQDCVVRVEDEVVITGYIERINVNYDCESHSIVVEGRDRTADVIDGSGNGANVEYQADLSFEEVIRQTLQKNGITDIGVINTVQDLKNFSKGEIESQNLGETIFEFLQRLAKKKQVFLTTDGLANITITRSEGVRVDEYLTNDPENPQSNIKSSNISYDYTERFNEYTVKSQENTAASNLFGNVSAPSSVVEKDKSVFDENIRSDRKITILGDSAYTSEQLIERAQWEANIRRVRSRNYQFTVQGHKRSKDSGIWKPNQLVQVKDVFSDIDDELLINRVSYSFSIDEGSITALDLVEKDAYKTEAELPVVNKKEKTSIFG
jgi:prophage tail gpP-like protein